jgi:hypothetical protein
MLLKHQALAFINFLTIPAHRITKPNTPTPTDRYVIKHGVATSMGKPISSASASVLPSELLSVEGAIVRLSCLAAASNNSDLPICLALLD